MESYMAKGFVIALIVIIAFLFFGYAVRGKILAIRNQQMIERVYCYDSEQ